jgi:CRP/FNR family cyclic AMP-dependent transcriptional regulator
LLRLATEGRSDSTGIISMHINQADLASMIGTTRPRVSHFMNKFRRMGFIEYNRQGYVTVHKALSRALLDRQLSTGFSTSLLCPELNSSTTDCMSFW